MKDTFQKYQEEHTGLRHKPTKLIEMNTESATNKSNEKITLYLLFGLDAVRAYEDYSNGSKNTVEEEIEKKTGGCYEYMEKHFDTEGECSAYLEGIRDMSGWGDFMTLDRKLNF